MLSKLKLVLHDLSKKYFFEKIPELTKKNRSSYLQELSGTSLIKKPYWIIGNFDRPQFIGSIEYVEIFRWFFSNIDNSVLSSQHLNKLIEVHSCLDIVEQTKLCVGYFLMNF